MRAIPVAGITAFVGANGSGKTALAVHERIKHAQRTGRDLYSTVDIDYKDPKGRERLNVKSKPIESLEHLADLKSADVLLDEVAAIASSRDTIGLPPQLVNFLGSLRHHDLTVSWTAPSWNRADKVLREVTQLIVVSRPLLRFRAKGLTWPRTYYSFTAIYDGYGSSDGDAPMGRPSQLRLVPVWRLRSIGAYDSWAAVPHLGDHSSTCAECGKRKRTEYCSGHGSAARGDVATRAPVVSLTSPGSGEVRSR